MPNYMILNHLYIDVREKRSVLLGQKQLSVGFQDLYDIDREKRDIEVADSEEDIELRSYGSQLRFTSSPLNLPYFVICLSIVCLAIFCHLLVSVLHPRYECGPARKFYDEFANSNYDERQYISTSLFEVLKSIYPTGGSSVTGTRPGQERTLWTLAFGSSVQTLHR